MFLLAALAALFWRIVLLLPWQPWRNSEILEVDEQQYDGDLSDLTVVIPSRYEVGVMQTSLSALAEQGGGLQVIMVDDHSTDGTSVEASKVEGLKLTIIDGEALPDGWSGKL
jgi:hypothetical protein